VPINLRLWSGRTLTAATVAPITVTVRSPKALLNLSNPSLGRLAKAYVEGQIDLDGDFRDVLSIGEAFISQGHHIYRKKAHSWKWWRHTHRQDRENIQRHYDVGNDFYALWLDANRVYSCAYFKDPDDSLDCAQEQKLDHICRKLLLRPGERFLDIGCGWGGLILWAARHYGVKALGITLSQGQFEYARERIGALGLEDQCEVRLLDYRDVPEEQPYDKIASVGMFEHVGLRNLPGYFAKINRLLKAGGLVMNHGITTNSLDDAELGSGIGEFVDRYVFPGGELPHLGTVVREMSGQGLELWDAESLRPHYAKTLWHWVDRLHAQRDKARGLVGEKTLRVWLIYMAGSAHAFARGWISIYQLLGVKPADNGTVICPLTRAHLYQ
jgi:cyclopropane-fatty-acyl-phospholipid synthase